MGKKHASQYANFGSLLKYLSDISYEHTPLFYFASNFLISVIIGQTIAMQIIKIPDSKNQ